MAHRNREKRAERKAREAEKRKMLYEEYENDDDDYDEDDEDDYEPRRGPHPAIIALIVTALILFGGYQGLMWLSNDSLTPINPDDNTEVLVIVSEGDSTSAVAKTLMDRGILKGGLVRGYLTEYFFKTHCERMGYNYGDRLFKYGEYYIPKNMSVDEIAEKLIAGVEVASTKTFTIPEGLTISQVAHSLAEQGIVSETAFYSEVRDGVFDYPFLKDCPPGDERLEGFLYPNTYEVFEDVSAHDVIVKMLDEFDRRFTTEYYARLSDMGMSIRDVVTMASIIERESVRAEERPIMAGVFYNRLDTGMLLESCATIQYIFIARGESAKEYLTIADTQTPSEYNTYLNEGLPPGPICNPRIESIEAALYPDENDYIFFVLSANLDGSHKFSADFAEFEKNKAAYYAAVEGR